MTTNYDSKHVYKRCNLNLIVSNVSHLKKMGFGFYLLTNFYKRVHVHKCGAMLSFLLSFTFYHISCLS